MHLNNSGVLLKEFEPFEPILGNELELFVC